uniref:Clone ZZD1176 mRNA sequence n=1 Tax=Schistosoma japonicum TaxID=6182 RepID=Q86F23_SCHJA|nr:hypothetical protein [Schistosoma japonicum]
MSSSSASYSSSPLMSISSVLELTFCCSLFFSVVKPSCLTPADWNCTIGRPAKVGLYELAFVLESTCDLSNFSISSFGALVGFSSLICN